MGLFLNKYPNNELYCEKSRPFDTKLENTAVFEWCMCLLNNDAETNYKLFNEIEKLISDSNLNELEKYREHVIFIKSRNLMSCYAKVIKCPYSDEKERMIFVIKDMANDLRNLKKDGVTYLKALEYVNNINMPIYYAKYHGFHIDLFTGFCIDMEVAPVSFIGLINSLEINI